MHLWPGLVSGIVVVILGITGCILVFEEQFKNAFFPWLRSEEPAGRSLLPPSVLYKKVSEALPGKDIQSVWYHGKEHTAHFTVDADSVVYVDPYSGKVVAMMSDEDFFHFIDIGHTRLWLPQKIGVQIVGWSTFVFFTLLITGMILWWPKKWNQKSRDLSFKVRWKARFKKLNYDLHNVFGFYALLVSILFALTGMIMSFSWFNKSVFWLAGGETKEYIKPTSDTTYNPQTTMLVQVDKAWKKGMTELGEYEKDNIIVHFPEKASEAIYVCVDMYHGSWRDIYLDQHTLKQLPASQGKLKNEQLGSWIRRSNYGLHLGLFGGLTTQIIFFLGSLICASLPITGFYIWWGKRKRTAKKAKAKLVQVEVT